MHEVCTAAVRKALLCSAVDLWCGVSLTAMVIAPALGTPGMSASLSKLCSSRFSPADVQEVSAAHKRVLPNCKLEAPAGPF
jgi:hypothetical protein